MKYMFSLLLLLLTASYGSAQVATTSLSGTIIDEAGAIIAGASVTVLNPATGFFRETMTTAEGFFTFPFLPAGNYKVTITQPGFSGVEMQNLLLNEPHSLLIRLKVRGIREAIVIYAKTGLRDSAAVGTLIDRHLVKNLPLNGQDFQPLITLTPGVVTATSNGGLNPGQYSFNGQRPTSNYFMVDGVSANISAGSDDSYQQAFIGALPGLSVFGGFNNLVSVEALQEIHILTSAYAPEFGRTPGAQVSIVTRSGTNKFHGALFNYLRNDAFDAGDWFANRAGLKKPPLRHNDFGGVLGGPVWLPKLSRADRSFFFFSYEGLRLRRPQFMNVKVPSMSLRQRADDRVKPYLESFPIPNGPEDSKNGSARFLASYSTPATLDAAGVRIDHAVNDRLTLFGRYNDAPSENVTRDLREYTQGPSVLSKTELDTKTLTIGGTLTVTPKMSSDLRLNYSRTLRETSFSLDDIGGAVPLPDSVFFPEGTSRDNSKIGFELNFIGPSPSLTIGKDVVQLQRQINLVNTFSLAIGRHQLKFGGDYRRMSPVYAPVPNAQDARFNSPLDVETAKAVVLSTVTRGAEPVFTNLSTFAQDTWRAGKYLVLTYGLRWELNPTPSVSGGLLPPGVIYRYDKGTVYTPRVPDELGNLPPRKTSSANFAPRFGVSYQLSQTRNLETILRGGIGIFYALGSGFATYGYDRQELLFDQPFPIKKLIPVPRVKVISEHPLTVGIIDPEIKLPSTLRWNIALEQSLGKDQTISATYIAALGRRLLNLAAVPDPNLGYPDFGVIKNEGRSDYHSLQIQYQRRLKQGLQALANHTWSHSIDLVSDDFQLDLDRGPSDFDIRHVFSAAVTYDLPAPKIGPGIARRMLHNWGIDSIIRWHSALPVNPVDGRETGWISRSSGNILADYLRPNLITGRPLYIKDPSAPGGKRINPEAFSPPILRCNPWKCIPGPVPLHHGTLGRNAVRGFSFHQIDLSLRRRFNLSGKIGLQFKADIFNLFNHPNFNNPDNKLYDGTIYDPNYDHPLPSPNPLFGLSSSMVGRTSIGAGGIGSLNTLYQAGGPRSIQFSLKLEF